ncbi:MAG: hypothetical protein NTZ50_03405 [Chloroflexi bacterium]|nr:hypothetical protein [Chloroflexota bacterium]
MSIRSVTRVTALLFCTALLSSCSFVRAIVPLQSPPPSPTPRGQQPPTFTPRPTAIPPTQTPIPLPTATLNGPTLPEEPSATPPPAPTADAAAPLAPPALPKEPANSPPPPTVTPLPAPPSDLTVVYGPPQTPNTRATSFAVVQTITALAMPATYPPTDTPRPRRTPVIIGSGPQDAPVTAQPGGVRVLNASRQVSPGGPAALSIRTSPNAVCALQIARPRPDGTTVLEPIAGSARLSADRDGGAAWIWTVDADEAAGPMNLVIDCGTAGTQQLTFTVLHAS